MMDLIDQLRSLAAKIPTLKEQKIIQTEEGTKNALVMPFINALGYNVFDPLEVTPELVADVGVKKGEKVDYAIKKDGKPIILFECKTFGTNLRETHASQLYRYFSVTAARFGVLTDGVVYRFYTDLVAPNKMDQDPFFVFDMMDIKEQNLEELKKFTKAMYDETGILNSASVLKYKGLIKEYFTTQLTQPSEAFIRLCIQSSNAYSGRITQAVVDEFAPIVRESLRLFINDQVEARLKSALARDTAAEAQRVETAAAEQSQAEAMQRPIVTTQDEIEAFFIVKSIIREVTNGSRIVMRDAQSYCSILLDDNNRRPICRLRFNGAQKYLGLFNDKREEERIAITSLDDIYTHRDRLISMVNYYDHKPLAVAE